MARTKNKSGRKETGAASRAIARKILLHVAIAVMFFAAVGSGFYYVKQYVDTEVAVATEPPTIVLKNKPHWMSEFLVAAHCRHRPADGPALGVRS